MDELITIDATPLQKIRAAAEEIENANQEQSLDNPVEDALFSLTIG